MRLIKRQTKNSIQVLVEDQQSRNNLRNAINDLSDSYEFRLVEESFFSAVEVYLDVNLPNIERQLQVKDIMDAFKKHLGD